METAAENRQVKRGRWPLAAGALRLRMRELKLLDVTGMEFGMLHGELSRLRRDGWELMPPAEAKPGTAGADGRLTVLLSRSRVAELCSQAS